MIVAGLQLDLVWEDRAANLERAARGVARAAAAGAGLVILPETFAYGFSMRAEAVAEAPDGPTCAFLEAQALQHRVWVAGSLAVRTREHPRPANTLVVCGPGGERYRYEKIHPFTYGREDAHYSAGTRLVTATVQGVRCTLFICYDLRFANVFWETAGRTDCYIVVANWPARRREHWSTLLRARAIENQAYVVGINRVGQGGGLEYAGDSTIIDPWGEVLVRASKAETMILAEISPETVAEARARFPVAQDRRAPGSYE